MSDVDYNIAQIVQGELLARHVIYLMRRGAAAVQAEHGLVVDGAAGPRTRAAVDALLQVVPPRGVAPAIVPRGKGMFIRDLRRIGTRAQVLEQMTRRGLSWVAIQRIWQYDEPGKQSASYNASSLVDYAGDLRAAGHEVWIWGYPAPGKHVEFVERVVGAAVQVAARGVIVDPELPFKNRMEPAVELMTLLLREAGEHGLGVGVTSYGAPWNFPTFPWKAFLGAHFGVPQLYDANNNLPKTYPKDAVAAWKALGFKRIVPASAAFNKDPAAMTALLAATPVDGAICWWDWFNCSQAPGRWDAVQAYTPGE
jgi:hypothetical protein